MQQSCESRWFGYARAICCLPASRYVLTLGIALVVVGFCSFFFGAAYASLHDDPVRFGPLEWFIGPIMAISFVFFVGLRSSSAMEGLMMDEDASMRHHREQLCRTIGVLVFSLGGAFLGVSLVFFRWFDSVPFESLSCNATVAPVINSTFVPEFGYKSLVPAYALLLLIASLCGATATCFCSTVMREQEERSRRGEEEENL